MSIFDSISQEQVESLIGRCKIHISQYSSDKLYYLRIGNYARYGSSYRMEKFWLKKAKSLKKRMKSL
jgi:hypothetical protein